MDFRFLFSSFAQHIEGPSATMGAIDKLARTPLSQVVLFVAVCTVIRLAVTPKLLNTPAHLRSGAYSVAKLVNEAMDAIVYAGVFVFLLIRPFGVQTFFIPSESMVPTLLVRDYIVANKFVYRVSEPKVGDIVVFRPPSIALRPDQGETDFIKRLIGTPGEVIEIHSGKLYRDGKMVDEKYTNEDANRDFKLVEYKGEIWPVNDDGYGINTGGITVPQFALDPNNPEDIAKMNDLRALPPAKVPDGYYLMMGDNRNRSLDSRGWGLVPRRQIIGRSEFIWLPFSRWRITR